MTDLLSECSLFLVCAHTENKSEVIQEQQEKRHVLISQFYLTFYGSITQGSNLMTSSVLLALSCFTFITFFFGVKLGLTC